MEDFPDIFLKAKEQDPNGKAKERIKLVDELDTKMQKNPNLLYWTTKDFIVAFHSFPNISKRFGIEATPSNLANFLQANLARMLEHFQVEMPDTFQFLEIDERKVLKFMAGGYHTRGGKSQFSFKKWQYARFSKVFTPGGRSNSGNEPLFYEVAAHEAIGHGLVEPQILPNWEDQGKDPVQFLREGLASYVELLSVGVDPHDFMGDNLINNAYLNLGYDYETKDSKLPQKVHRKSFGADVAVADVFKLVDKEGKLPKFFLEYADFANYFMGASFIHFFVEKFGMDKFKKWVKGIDSNNFLETLQAETGYSIRDIQKDWKQRVLEGSVVDNKVRANATKDFSDEDKEREQSNYIKIKEIFERYA